MISYTEADDLWGQVTAILAVLLLLNLFLLKESPADRGLPPAEENPQNLFAHSADGQGTETDRSSLAILRRLFSSYAFWLVCILSLGTTLLRETFSLWTPTYFTQFAHMTSAQAASGSAIFPLFGGISVLLAG
jgi:OPA family glycerol-3-phosphate transporter-like MFS transporter